MKEGRFEPLLTVLIETFKKIGINITCRRAKKALKETIRNETKQPRNTKRTKARVQQVQQRAHFNTNSKQSRNNANLGLSYMHRKQQDRQIHGDNTMNKAEIKVELNNMPAEEVRENLAYLINEMDPKEQAEFLGVQE